MDNVQLAWVTPNAEEMIGYCARVSNPTNQANKDVAKLLKYCYQHKHFSIFEMAHMCMEIATSRAISAQILRHRSFSFQEFSQRYAPITTMAYYKPRRQDLKNRQNSIDDLDEEVIDWFTRAQGQINQKSLELYQEALNKGIAKECARILLPLATETRLYMVGSVRSWIHYIQLRCDPSTQKEHRDIAEKCKNIFIEQLPIIGALL